MKFAATLNTRICIGRAVRRLELQIDIGAVGALFLNHPTKRFIVMRLTPRTDMEQRRLPAIQKVSRYPSRCNGEKTHVMAFFTSIGAVRTRTKSRT